MPVTYFLCSWAHLPVSFNLPKCEPFDFVQCILICIFLLFYCCPSFRTPFVGLFDVMKSMWLGMFFFAYKKNLWMLVFIGSQIKWGQNYPKMQIFATSPKRIQPAFKPVNKDRNLSVHVSVVSRYCIYQTLVHSLDQHFTLFNDQYIGVFENFWCKLLNARVCCCEKVKHI